MTTEQGDATTDVASHLAESLEWINQQIKLAEYLHKGGDTTIRVDLPNYISLHRFTRELLLTLDVVERARISATSRVQALELERAFRAIRRPVGRPRKFNLAALPALRTGLLGGFNESLAPEPRKGGRPRKHTEDFWAALNVVVVEAWMARNGDSAKLNVSVALTAVLDDYAASKAIAPKEAARKISEIHRNWYRPLMKYRKSIGESVYMKSQNRPEKRPDFGPLLASFERLNTAFRSGKHHAATKGTHGPQTGNHRARKR